MPKRWSQMLTTASRNTAFEDNYSFVFDVKRSGGRACADVTSKALTSNEVADSLLSVTSKLPGIANEVTKTGILRHGSSYALSRHSVL